MRRWTESRRLIINVGGYHAQQAGVADRRKLTGREGKSFDFLGVGA